MQWTPGNRGGVNVHPPRLQLCPPTLAALCFVTFAARLALSHAGLISWWTQGHRPSLSALFVYSLESARALLKASLMGKSQREETQWGTGEEEAPENILFPRDVPQPFSHSHSGR